MKRYIVFGASGGIGKSYIKLIGEKDDVLITCISHSKEKLEQIREEYGSRYGYILADLSDSESIDEVFDMWIDQNNDERIDGVVFAAGVEGVRPIRVMSSDYFESVLRINCVSFMQICRYMASKKYSNDNASIVAISSLTSLNLSNCEGAYGISKVALNSTVKQASIELMGRRIRVNAILPGSTETNMMNKVRERIPDFDEKLKLKQPLGMIDPIQVAYLVDFLMSDKASYITGACIPISGGRPF